jgi:antitoxin component YwqK of YwqJK toxin-antitoxin module
MNRLLIAAAFMALFSCNNNTSTTPDGELTPFLPPAAVMEPYNDGSGLVKATLYGANSIVLEQGDYLNGLREGVYTVFFPNGYINSTTGYVQGKKQGQNILMDDKGQLLEASTYHQDVLNGPYVKYNRSRIKETRNYVDGKLHGEVVKFYANGTIMERSNYSAGQLNGVSRWYDQQGNNTIAYEYNMGELLGEVDLEAAVPPSN